MKIELAYDHDDHIIYFQNFSTQLIYVDVCVYIYIIIFANFI
jgi:hypothetical protein